MIARMTDMAKKGKRCSRGNPSFTQGRADTRDETNRRNAHWSCKRALKELMGLPEGVRYQMSNTMQAVAKGARREYIGADIKCLAGGFPPGTYEIRESDPAGTYRCVYNMDEHGLFLICAFQKKTQHTNLKASQLIKSRIKDLNAATSGIEERMKILTEQTFQTPEKKPQPA